MKSPRYFSCVFTTDPCTVYYFYVVLFLFCYFLIWHLDVRWIWKLHISYSYIHVCAFCILWFQPSVFLLQTNMPMSNERFHATLPQSRPLPDPNIQTTNEKNPTTVTTSTPIESPSASSISDEYAQPMKNAARIESPDTVAKIRSNTTGKLQQKQGSPLLRSNSDVQGLRNRSSLVPPTTDIVYQHTTSVVKSVIELNTGVQHAQPEEFVDLVKVN